jgi:hypothetical protein
MKIKSSTVEWRPEIGTKVKIVQHSKWGGFIGRVASHGKWMGMRTLEVNIDNLGELAGITTPEQIEIINEPATAPDGVIYDMPEDAETLMAAEAVLGIEVEELRKKLTDQIRESMAEIKSIQDKIDNHTAELQLTKEKLRASKRELRELI